MSNFSRRDFLKTSAVLASATALVGCASSASSDSGKETVSAVSTPHVAAQETLRIGLVGCGGRGTGAAGDCLGPNEGVKLVALGDLFPERIKHAREALKVHGEKFAVTDDKCFLGFDAYQKVINSDVDLVIFATPPGFRPGHIEAAVAAGKHIFAEKPVAVDPTGVRRVLASADKISAHGLGFVCGTQRRHDFGYNETMKRIHDGALGEIVSGSVYWNQGGLWMFPREASWTDMEWQMRNWLYFTWLSGDHIVEQHVHNIDVFNWAMNDHPISAYGMGGRQVRTDPAYGHIYDHFTIEYEYKNGARLMSQCRQQDGTDARVGEHIVGTLGTSDGNTWIKGKNAWSHKKGKDEEGKKVLGPYQQEHVDLINSIRAGKPLNEAKRIAETCLTAIMGRLTAYTGKLIKWEDALNSPLNLMPEKVAFGNIAVPPVAMPGKYTLPAPTPNPAV